MSKAKERKYAKRVRNQPSNVSLDQSDDPPGGRGSFQSSRDSTPGSSGQQQRGFHQARFPSRGGRGRGPSNELSLPLTYATVAKTLAEEINTMRRAVSQKSQSLPRHMRRRALAYDIKRLPRRVREIAKKEMEKTVHQKKEKSKSKCRKARRLHGNLLLEFNRRQRKDLWLETHIWHAKRYHMLKKWGYCLADRRTTNSYRTCYRAMSNHCLLQDLSYYCCVELLGQEEDLLKALSRVCSIDTGLTFKAAPCISGKRQGSLVLYRADKYPEEALGHVTFIWKPRGGSDAACDKRQLWIWMHPTFKADVLKELRLVCACEERADNFVCVSEPAPPPPLTEEPPPPPLTEEPPPPPLTEEPPPPPLTEEPPPPPLTEEPPPPPLTEEPPPPPLTEEPPPPPLTEEPPPPPLTEEPPPPPLTEEPPPPPLTEEPPPPPLTEEPPPPPLTEEPPPPSVTGAGRKRKLKDKGEQAVPVKMIIGDGTRDAPDPYYWTSRETGITIRDLTMEIVRYRLVGPMSNCVLGDALQAAPLHKETEASGPHRWWADYCKDSENVLRHNSQESLFNILKGLESPAQVPSGTVLGLTVGDPRLNLPNKKTKSFPNLGSSEDRDKVRAVTQSGVPVECAESLLWSSEVRSHVMENKISEQELNRLRSELLVPASRLDLGNSESKIPVLLIQQPGKVTGKDHPGWGSGWDICLPKGWGMAFWIPLVFRGVRVGGLQQGLQHFHYMGAPNVPGDFPDTPAGVQSAQEDKAQLLENYTRRPPAKRTNFIKNGVLAPFHCPWDQLTREWELRPSIGLAFPKVQPAVDKLETKEKPSNSPSDDEMSMELSAVSTEEGTVLEDTEGGKDFSVLRNKKILQNLSALVAPVIHGRKGPSDHSQQLSHLVGAVLRDFPRSLVWVRLSMLAKGSPELHGLICIPSEQDLLHLQQDKSFPGPLEPKHGDRFKEKVSKLKKDKKKGKKNQKAAENDVVVEASCNDDLTLGLWPSPLPEVTSHCSRALLGYVTQGDFSLAMGHGDAVGFVSFTGLAHMLAGQPEDKTGLVLVRNPTTLQYRFAKLTIEV